MTVVLSLSTLAMLVTAIKTVLSTRFAVTWLIYCCFDAPEMRLTSTHNTWNASVDVRVYCM